MRIFLSHSSRQKPLVREVKKYLPEHINEWIDEKDLLVGDEIDADADFVILFIDSYAVESAWATSAQDRAPKKSSFCRLVRHSWAEIDEEPLHAKSVAERIKLFSSVKALKGENVPGAWSGTAGGMRKPLDRGLKQFD